MEYKMNIKINTDVIKRKVMTVCIRNALGMDKLLMQCHIMDYWMYLCISPGNDTIDRGYLSFYQWQILNHHSVHPPIVRARLMRE